VLGTVSSCSVRLGRSVCHPEERTRASTLEVLPTELRKSFGSETEGLDGG
jgi:hypothetical protein